MDANRPRSIGRVAAYITSHGFGHLNRTGAVLNRLPADVPLTVRCHPDLFDACRQRLRRPVELDPYVADAGAVNPPGESAATDGPATIARARAVHAEAMARVEVEARRLRDQGTAAVICDAPAPPLVAARRAEVPGFLLANFTWAEIYAPHAEALGGDAPSFVRTLADAYDHATAFFRCEPSLPLAGSPPRIEVGLVVEPGRDRRSELLRRLGLGHSARIIYLYVGRYGQAGLGWHNLSKLASRGIHFVGFHPAPSGAPTVPNLHVVSATDWTGADLAATADAVVAKAGYGTVAEAMAAGTPIVYPPRHGFAEHAALDASLRRWGGGVPADADAFASFDLGPLLDRALSLRPEPPPFPVDGAARVAAHLTALARVEEVRS